MNTKSLILALATAAAASATFAQEATPEPWNHTAKSVLTRAEVQAQAAANLAAGQARFGEATQFFDTRSATPLALSRAQVAAEAREAGRLGLVNVGEGVSRLPNAQELANIRAAGQRAIEVRTAAMT